MAASAKAPAPIASKKVSIDHPGAHRAPKLVLVCITAVSVFSCFYPWMVTHRSEGWTAYDMGLAYLVVLAAQLTVHLLDWVTYDGGRTSVKIAGLFGYSPRKVIILGVLNAATACALFVGSVALLGASSEARVPDLTMLARCVVCIAAIDLAFYLGHGHVMHTKLPAKPNPKP